MSYSASTLSSSSAAGSGTRQLPVRGVTDAAIDTCNIMTWHTVNPQPPAIPPNVLPPSFELVEFGELAVALQGSSTALKLQALARLMSLLQHPTTLPRLIANAQKVFSEGAATGTVDEDTLKASLADRLIAAGPDGAAPASGHLPVRHSGPHYAGDLFQDVVDTLEDASADCRARAAAVLRVATAAPLGLEFAVKVDIFPRLMKLSEDPSADCRAGLYAVLLNLTKAPNSTALDRMLKRGLIATLVTAAGAETAPAVTEALLAVLASAVRRSTALAAPVPAAAAPGAAPAARGATELSAEAETALALAVSLLSSSDDAGVWAGAARVIAAAALAAKGQNHAVALGAAPLLCAALASAVPAVREAAAGALMQVTVSRSGKVAVT